MATGTLDDINGTLAYNAGTNEDNSTDQILLEHLKAFNTSNSNPASSPNLARHEGDDMSLVVEATTRLLESRDASTTMAEDDSEHLCMLFCTTLKICSRKQENRVNFGRNGVLALVALLQGRSSCRIRGEAANVTLNVCYERSNVIYFVEAGGVPPLLQLIQSEDNSLQANAAGAIQSICYQKSGRVAVRNAGGVELILSLLSTSARQADEMSIMRSMGALHNISSDEESTRIIRRNDGIPLIVSLMKKAKSGLSGDNNAVLSSAAGAVQNISREVASREIVSRHPDAVPVLAELLFSSDVQAQVCAAGALINIIGPVLEEEDESKSRTMDHLMKATASNSEAKARRLGRRGSAAGFNPLKNSEHVNANRNGLGQLLTSCLTLGLVARTFDENLPASFNFS